MIRYLIRRLIGWCNSYPVLVVILLVNFVLLSSIIRPITNNQQAWQSSVNRAIYGQIEKMCQNISTSNQFVQSASFLPNKTLSEKEVCRFYTEDAGRDRLVVHNVLNSPLRSEHDSLVTMVTQMSAERIGMLSQIAKHWKGSISVSLYTTESRLRLFVCRYYNDSTLRHRNNIYVHLINEEGVYYPVNYLRNVALQFDSGSSFVFLNDIDFIPAPNLEDEIRRHIEADDVGGKQTLIVPAFATNKKIDEWTPSPKQELLGQWKNGDVEPFHQRSLTPGHKQMNFSRWSTASATYEVFYKEYFEPYVVVERSVVPRYLQRFVGRYYDKSSHIMQLSYSGFRFIVAPNTFVVHLPHEKRLEDHKIYYKCADVEYRKLKKQLQRSYIRRKQAAAKKQWA